MTGERDEALNQRIACRNVPFAVITQEQALVVQRARSRRGVNDVVLGQPRLMILSILHTGHPIVFQH
jgi:hypothetical protein